MDERVRKAIYDKVDNEPFAKLFGLKLVDLEAGYSKVEMTLTRDMENMFGMAHGAALFALIDEAFETAVNSHGTVAVALNVTVSYIAAPTTGSKLRAEAREISRTRKTANFDIKVYDDEDRLITSCQALAYRKGVPLPFLQQVHQGDV